MKIIPRAQNLPTPTNTFGKPVAPAQWYVCPHCKQQSPCNEPPTRTPLTDEQINSLRHIIDWTAEWSYNKFARAIERAHGINEL